ncbi:hypothetical protein KB20921_08800 [Edwardsiella ictaluri]|nr:hypothetical protein KH20906_08770 [Edwardsiella ictaluri]BEI01619.1 hypothetical protein KB20921_08800 [Edwardsiella ictaluri]BEI05088.1 hypothetical protein KH201010_08740 [Edwardsiella ictaluri]BEI08543.1 hypothetical protein STU22726_08740 [Edwardsiella ictaluri]BEI12026.1 hypothetical protein STU22816_08790 [Edwardsiella ictaluri]
MSARAAGLCRRLSIVYAGAGAPFSLRGAVSCAPDLSFLLSGDGGYPAGDTHGPAIVQLQ